MRASRPLAAAVSHAASSSSSVATARSHSVMPAPPLGRPGSSTATAGLSRGRRRASRGPEPQLGARATAAPPLHAGAELLPRSPPPSPPGGAIGELHGRAIAPPAPRSATTARRDRCRRPRSASSTAPAGRDRQRGPTRHRQPGRAGSPAIRPGPSAASHGARLTYNGTTLAAPHCFAISALSAAKTTGSSIRENMNTLFLAASLIEAPK